MQKPLHIQRETLVAHFDSKFRLAYLGARVDNMLSYEASLIQLSEFLQVIGMRKKAVEEL